MSKDPKIRQQAVCLRGQGLSIPSIARTLGVAKSTAWLWTKDVNITDDQALKLAENSVDGNEKGRAVLKAIRQRQQDNRIREAEKLVASIPTRQSRTFWKLIAAVLFWCEGGKRQLSSLRFANSDPKLVQCFLFALRHGFTLNEGRFRALVHIHGYHNDAVQRTYWSKVTGIPLSRFSKSYQKRHTGARKRDGYQGCLSLRYNDAALARMLDAVYHAFAKRF